MSLKDKLKQIAQKEEKGILSRIIREIYITRKLGFSILFINFLFQRILRNNSDVDISVHFTSKVSHFNNIKINRDIVTISSFAVSGNCYIQGYNGIIAGKNLLFAPGVKIISSNHDLNDVSKPTDNPPIQFGDNVWIGANAVILPGVKIGNGVVIGSGAIVTKSFEGDNLIIAGNPAKIIGEKKQ